MSMKINDSVKIRSSSEERFGILIDSKLAFPGHITNLCSKPNHSALTHASDSMTT